MVSPLVSLNMLEDAAALLLAAGVILDGLTSSGLMRPCPGLAVRNLAGLGEAEAAVGDLHLVST